MPRRLCRSNLVRQQSATKFRNQPRNYRQREELGQKQNVESSRVDSKDAQAAFETLQKSILKDNEREEAVKKKTVTFISDFIDKELLISLQKMDENNVEVYVHFPDYAQSENVVANYSNLHRLLDIGGKTNFCNRITNELTNNAQPKANVSIFLSDKTDVLTVERQIVEVLEGDACVLKPDNLYSDYATVHYGSETIQLPWVGNQTAQFAQQCLEDLFAERQKKSTGRKRKSGNQCQQSGPFFSQLQQNLATPAPNDSFVIYISDDLPKCFLSMISAAQSCKNCTNIYFDILINQKGLYGQKLYSEVYEPLTNAHFFKASANYHVMTGDSAPSACRRSLNMAPLAEMRPYVRPKSLSRALERFFLIILIATTSVTSVGAFFYRRLHKKRMEILEEMRELAMQPGTFKKAKECPKVARLPWEIKSDRIHLDYEFPLGEGTISVVYLGKLKGKSPIMQWIDRVEMKQFQDCAVAVRVPRQFDEFEENQLLREINSMKVLKHHTHINVLLGWTSKENLVCTVLELTHTNLTKYLAQLRDGVFASATALTASLIPYRHFLQIAWQICDAMTYITSKGLVHRDVASRNILLTTGLRVKVSGFGFCSEGSDTTFHQGASIINQLPVRWVAPEALEGRFSEQSDVWSFGITLDEMYSLGEVPYGEMKAEEFIQAIKCGERLRKPEFASEEIYDVMIRCWHKYPERRPRFAELQEKLQCMIEYFHDNPAFEINDE
ncbi:hypothetical protein L596_005257 [Steinernema carpocapsae]|uniref:Protein kinase domain-containing protein n=1 Tax=Steinernema carpocapsae TaxID=34508 RepID=A0A4U8UYJ2_STECR|nr:hypothetical protein L596_005257 [Steinernema carpocapsae]